MKTSCVRSSAASTFDVKRYARLKIRRENAVTISSQAMPSPARALRTSSAPLTSADALKASTRNLLIDVVSGHIGGSTKIRPVKAVLRYQKSISSNNIGQWRLAFHSYVRYLFTLPRHGGALA